MPFDETTQRLASFASELDPVGLPPEVTLRVKILLADSIASGLFGWTSDESRQVEATASRLLGSGDSTVIGSGRKVSPAGAAFINGYLITARSVCDVHQPTLCHVTPEVVPAALAAAELAPTDGRTLLAGLASGLEGTVRIGLGLNYPVARDRGWHTPGIAGLIGAAMGASRVLGLDSAATEGAMGIAGAQAGGTFASFGTPTIKFHQARSALGALMSAQLAADGFSGPTSILTAVDGGIYTTFSDGSAVGSATEGLGSTWELMNITTRLWPAAAALQSIMTIGAREPLPSPDDIANMTLSLPPASHEMNGEMGWSSMFEATLSARFVAAMVAYQISVWELPSHLTDEKLVRFAQDRVVAVVDPDLPEGAVRITTVGADGDGRTFTAEQPKGSPTDPATWDDVAEKLHRVGDQVLGVDRVDVALSMVDDLEDVANITELTTLVRPSG
jgi:2-methylcitrate dehydratase PrpD